MSGYPYDEDVRARVAQLLHAALPAMYRAEDARGPDAGALRAFLRVLAVPAAVLRQNIEELHADLFIDSAHDHIIPLLADMVGTSLVFPDAGANRRDVRGTMGWRRRKGGIRMLQEMGAELTSQLVVTQEGWKRLQLAQDLNLPRLERTVPDLRPAVVAEQATGPLDALFHAADLRSSSVRTGRYHPKHLVHWVHPTLTFPLRRAASVVESVPGSDQRYSMHPLGEWRQLRARSTPAQPIRTDRIPELHFAARPQDWFGVEGRFSIEICGLPAGLAQVERIERVASVSLADLELARGTVSVQLLEHAPRSFQGRMSLELGVAPILDTGPDTWRLDVSGFAARAAVTLDAAGIVASTVTPGPSAAGVAVLRVRPPLGIGGRFFPGATLMFAGGGVAARTASPDVELAREGFLRGALHVSVPPLQVVGERWLYVAADGSLHDAHLDSGATLVDMPRDSTRRWLSHRQLASTGPGAAWPPLAPSADPTLLTQAPSAPGRGPCVMHGGVPVQRVSGSVAAVPAGTRSALVFALRVEESGHIRYRPFQRLVWTGSDPGTGTWEALAANGTPVGSDAASVGAEYAEVAALREQSRGSFPVAVRYESSRGDVSLCPAEVAWTTDEGTTVLVHLPHLEASTGRVEDWPTDTAQLPGASVPLRVAADGSTWAAGSTANARMSLGAVAPMRDEPALRRRRVTWRRLCAWRNEDWNASPPRVLAPTSRGRLDVDVAHGLFALSAEDPVQLLPADAAGRRPPSVTSSFEEGATTHVGARPDAREPVLDQRLATPTRLVTGSGHFSANIPAEWHAIPRYATVTEALAAVSVEWAALTPADIEDFPNVETFVRSEVIQVEDSATYTEAPVWPSAPTNASVAAKGRFHLTLQAAERERPHLLVDPVLGWTSPAAPARLELLSLVGLALGGVGWGGMTVPLATEVRLALCSVLYPENRLGFQLDERGVVVIERCELAGLRLLGAGRLSVTDSLVDAGSATAIEALGGQVSLERVTVGGPVLVRELEASEVIFDDRVEVQDRFHGCVRYSRVTGDSVLPRVHRCVTDVRVDYVTLDRHDPAWRRLRAEADARIVRGAENGSEMGAFSATRQVERVAAFELRLNEYTPAGLATGTIRLD